ncbi:MAG: TlpA family protein disulfide reductase [Burkholderiales bacterium]|nr:MAG: TlpA family protein disulfide reductase [Burkholderiales bacterium]
MPINRAAGGLVIALHLCAPLLGGCRPDAARAVADAAPAVADAAPAAADAALAVALARIELAGLDRPGKQSLGMPGRATVVNFWAAWCEPCRREMRALECLHRLAPERLAVIGVSVDRDPNLARELLLASDVSFPNASDPGGAVSRDALGVDVLPSTLVVAADGSVLGRIVGVRDWTDPMLLAGYGITLPAARGASAPACSRERS